MSRAQTIDAIRCEGPWRRGGPAAYRVICETAPERRTGARARTRLRSGKLLDAALAFLVDCRIHDRSAGGLRIRLLDAATLPRDLHLYEDETGRVLHVRTIWRRGAEVGLRVLAHRPARNLPAAQRAALEGRYYGLRRTIVS